MRYKKISYRAEQRLYHYNRENKEKENNENKSKRRGENALLNTGNVSVKTTFCASCVEKRRYILKLFSYHLFDSSKCTYNYVYLNRLEMPDCFDFNWPIFLFSELFKYFCQDIILLPMNKHTLLLLSFIIFGLLHLVVHIYQKLLHFLP